MEAAERIRQTHGRLLAEAVTAQSDTVVKNTGDRIPVCDSACDVSVTADWYSSLPMEAPSESADFPLSFIVRVSRGKRALRGVVERVRSREKQAFHGVAALAEVIAEIAEG